MTQDKMRKIITACVSAATVLFILLLSYLIYQWVTLSVLDKREKQLIEENKRLEQAIEDGEITAEWYELHKDWLAFRDGWRPQEGD